MSDWMPTIDPQAMNAAMARRKFADKDQATMLEPLNRYKTALGRASSPEMYQAIQRQMAGRES